MSEVITSYKGFDKDLKCHGGFQYEIGKEYEQDSAKVCDHGFHACEMPLHVFNHFAPGAGSRYCVVEQSGEISRKQEDGDSKLASSKIKIGAEIGIPGLVKAQIEYVKERAKTSGKHHSTGDGSANSATGDGSANSATGYGSANSATGYGSANISTGNMCTNEGAGERNICVAWGKDSKCKGAIGCFLVLSEWGPWDGKVYPFLGAVMVEVDGNSILPDTWYTLKNGQIVVCEEE